ncbi:hypothetical protein CLIB1423_01S05578 [[Candida] railenensis]|uniref:SnoaL-like domain-containing protein n=1 Tax=[Candida] railenensis TaxID=45579 RepID=A0A9P0QKU2_9ASCO|nr:hypothetical protein CLIB1423_01S05578 [[Candida] railenensis]
MSEQVIRDFVEAINDRNYSRIEELVAGSYIYHGQSHPDRVGFDAAIIQALKPYLESTTSRFEIVKYKEDGEFSWTLTKYEGSAEDQETCLDRYKIKNNQIVEQWNGEEKSSSTLE